MPAFQLEVMQRLYRSNVWDGFQPVTKNAEVEGWNGTHPSLSRLASAPSERPLVIDVGTWKGQSTITLARAMKESNLDGCVIAVDIFLGSAEHWNGEHFTRRHAMPDIYQSFLDNVFSAGVHDYIVPVPQTSVTAAMIFRRLGFQATVVHVDAAHEFEEVLRDAKAYWKLLMPGGYMIGDDYNESWPDVMKAADEFSDLTGIPLTVDPPKWIIQKPRPQK